MKYEVYRAWVYTKKTKEDNRTRLIDQFTLNTIVDSIVELKLQIKQKYGQNVNVRLDYRERPDK